MRVLEDKPYTSMHGTHTSLRSPQSYNLFVPTRRELDTITTPSKPIDRLSLFRVVWITLYDLLKANLVIIPFWLLLFITMSVEVSSNALD